MAAAGGIGAEVALDAPSAAALFGEDQARYVVTCRTAEAAALFAAAAAAGVPASAIGATGGDRLTVSGALSITVDALAAAHEAWFPAFMGGRAQGMSEAAE